MTDVQTFQSWLEKGLGRAAVFLKANDVAPYQDALLYACSHNLTYDTQCEEARTPYLWRLIEAAKAKAFFRGSVQHYLKEGLDKPDEYEWSQLFGLAGRFAADGDYEMREAMYSAFQHLGFENAGVSAAHAFVELDAFQGLAFALNQFDVVTERDDLWQVDSLVSALENRFGQEQTAERIAEVARQSEKMTAALEAFNEFEQQQARANAHARSRPTPDYSALRRRAADPSWASEFLTWARKATTEELTAAADELLADAEPKKVVGCLRVFASRPFPGNPERLLSLADHENLRIRRAALIALSNVSDARVRSRGISLLQSKDRFADGARLLVSNFELADFRIIEKHLRGSMSADECHELGFSIFDMLDPHVAAEAEASLLLLYEKDPCSMCRRKVVRFLVQLDRLPEALRLECRYDADPETIKLASRPDAESEAESSL